MLYFVQSFAGSREGLVMKVWKRRSLHILQQPDHTTFSKNNAEKYITTYSILMNRIEKINMNKQNGKI